jgi:nicotinamide-nucleotide amidase
MKKMLQLFCEREEIEDRLAEYLPTLVYTLEGDCLEYTLTFPEVSRSESEDIDSLFEDEAYNNDEMRLAEMLVALAAECGTRLSTAESCTGGMLASSLVGIPGCSEVFYEGLVTYSNDSKIIRLGVDPETISAYGAVSAETAVEMANGLLSAGADLAISTTGIAGPSGGTREKPVGLVYIAVVSGKKSDVYRNIFTGDRYAIRKKSANAAMFYAIQHLKNNF